MRTWSGCRSQKSRVSKEAYSEGDPMAVKVLRWITGDKLCLIHNGQELACFSEQRCMENPGLMVSKIVIGMIDNFEEYSCRPKSYIHDLSGRP